MTLDADASAVHVELDVPARMRDGVVLRADVYRPVGEGPWPTLLIRTPYDKRDMSQNEWNGFLPGEVCGSGFMLVIQDVRGRYASDGEWEPLRHEGLDGADTVAWAAELDGSNGRVGMLGGSYCGHTQWRAAIEQPAALKAITPLMTWSEPREALVARGGAIQVSVITEWSLAAGVNWWSRQGLTDDELEARLAAIADDLEELKREGYLGLPIGELPVLARNPMPRFVQPTEADDLEATAHMRIAGHHQRVTVPSMHSGGWFDSCLQATLEAYATMRDLGLESRLVVGPWSHENFGSEVGALDFGAGSSREAAVHPHGSWSAEVLAFLRRHMEDEAQEARSTPVRIFVMGRNEWRAEESWPLERARTVRWYLHSDGGLTVEAPGDETASEIDYNPADPVPTWGGTLNLGPGRGPVDQGPVEARQDVLVFTSDVLEQDLEVTGRIRVKLQVQSSVPSTDWVARLCDVHPDGRSFNLCDGILRIHHGADEVQEIEIDLWSTSNVFLAGHRVRLDVANSSFPRWDRNLNTGDQSAAAFAVAHQTLFHGSRRSSYLELPTVTE